MLVFRPLRGDEIDVEFGGDVCVNWDVIKEALDMPRVWILIKLYGSYVGDWKVIDDLPRVHCSQTRHGVL